ncbi:MAG: hypothetical protein C5B49_08485 [Bdellovibrio sp.]|nr:MAG: hypothetical protein C5B49_08485 [Bdellovibrio sp.]
MNLRRMEVFLAVYKHGSLTAAATHLGLTKSAISQALTLLEQEIQNLLFIRESRRLIPTHVADSLYGQVGPLMESITQIYHSIGETSPTTVGTLNIGVPPDLASTFIIPCLAEFAKQYPGVSCRLKLGTPLVLGPLLINNQLDFALIDASEVYERLYPLSAQLLTREKHVLVCSQDYHKSRRSSDTSYEEFCDERFVAYTPEAIEIRFWSKHHFKKVPRHLEVSLVVDQVTATKTAILHGFGFGHIPERIVREEMKKGQVWVWPTRTPKYENRIALAQLAGKKPTKIERLATRFITDYFRRNHLEVI